MRQILWARWRAWASVALIGVAIMVAAMTREDLAQWRGQARRVNPGHEAAQQAHLAALHDTEDWDCWRQPLIYREGIVVVASNYPARVCVFDLVGDQVITRRLPTPDGADLAFMAVHGEQLALLYLVGEHRPSSSDETSVDVYPRGTLAVFEIRPGNLAAGREYDLDAARFRALRAPGVNAINGVAWHEGEFVLRASLRGRPDVDVDVEIGVDTGVVRNLVSDAGIGYSHVGGRWHHDPGGTAPVAEAAIVLDVDEPRYWIDGALHRAPRLPTVRQREIAVDRFELAIESGHAVGPWAVEVSRADRYKLHVVPGPNGQWIMLSGGRTLAVVSATGVRLDAESQSALKAEALAPVRRAYAVATNGALLLAALLVLTLFRSPSGSHASVPLARVIKRWPRPRPLSPRMLVVAALLTAAVIDAHRDVHVHLVHERPKVPSAFEVITLCNG